MTAVFPGRRGVLTPSQRIPFGDGRVLEIRPMNPADAAGIAALYEGLDDESRARRFFTMFHPRPPFFERLASVADRGGAGVVAVDIEPTRARIVGESSFELLPNGNGELSITVDRCWRGWLGASLLDALVEAAARLRIPNLEAEILATNAPMLALVRARGYVVFPRRNRAEIRAVIGVAGRLPVWTAPNGRTRVLLEGPDESHWDTDRLGPPGSVDVLACAGPTGGHIRCPALDGRACALAAEADVIVVSHPPDAVEWDAVRAAHPLLHPGVPVHVEPTAELSRSDSEHVLPV